MTNNSNMSLKKSKNDSLLKKSFEIRRSIRMAFTLRKRISDVMMYLNHGLRFNLLNSKQKQKLEPIKEKILEMAQFFGFHIEAGLADCEDMSDLKWGLQDYLTVLAKVLEDRKNRLPNYSTNPNVDTKCNEMAGLIHDFLNDELILWSVDSSDDSSLEHSPQGSPQGIGQ